MATVDLEIPPRSVYVGVVRLAITALARSAELDEDRVEDLKIAVSEACANAVIAHEEAGIEDPVSVSWSDNEGRLKIEVKAAGPGLDATGPGQDSAGFASRHVLSIALLKSLVEGCDIEELPDGGSLTRLNITL